MKKWLLICLILPLTNKVFTQDTLPNFKALAITKNKAVISWKHNFGNNCKQITIQRSYDSLKYFKAIFSSLSPELPENGYVDNDYLSGLKNYYRILYVFDDGSYFFTKSKTPIFSKETIEQIIQDKKTLKQDNLEDKIEKNYINTNFSTLDLQKKLEESLGNFKAQAVEKNKIEEEKKRYLDSIKIHILDSISNLPIPRFFTVFKRNIKKPLFTLNEENFEKFKDSILCNSNDTLIINAKDYVFWKPFLPPSWKPSNLIYTNNKGYLQIDLETIFKRENNYSLKIFDAKGKEVFSIKNFHHTKFSFDKSNFIFSGWYFFELFENGKLIEKNKFLLEEEIR